VPNSVGGFKYYISFIDDFSKFTWIYLMNDRTDAQHIFMLFHAHVERLLDIKIKCVQYDWGWEYQKLHHQFFLKFGIAHHVSCPHTHQQNGSVERKHRHIVETGLALLAHAGMPLKFWNETFTTTTDLINRLPTRVIDNLCPIRGTNVLIWIRVVSISRGVVFDETVFPFAKPSSNVDHPIQGSSGFNQDTNHLYNLFLANVLPAVS
jgi:hypothetical protein